MAPLLVIEGPDAAGKSTLVDALAADLDGAPFHHSRPRRGADPLEAALHYACVRRAWVLAWPHHTNGGLLVLDRSHWSSRVLGRALGETLSRREREAGGRPAAPSGILARQRSEVTVTREAPEQSPPSPAPEAVEAFRVAA